MRVHVYHDIDDLASDLAAIPVKFAAEAPGVVAKSARKGNKLARQFAKEGAGSHGTNYYKRVTPEARGALEWEYGPEGIPKSDFVGVGFRHGRNTDLPRSADAIGPDFQDSVGDLVDRLFW